ncbi:MAG: hypothetical protein PVG65_00200 [Candidatus Thorarchaeota archaeon]|jgi:hypothetical protein
MWIVNFIDGTQISSNQRDWKLLPSIPIASLMYRLPNGKFLVMSGFEKYLQIREDYDFLLGAKGEKLWTWNFLGKHKDIVYQFSHHIAKAKTFQIQNKWGVEFRSLNIIPLPAKILPNKKTQKQYKIEFGSPRKTNHADWHQGIPSGQATVKII